VTAAPPPLDARPPEPPDRDYDALRVVALDSVRAHAPTWTDHNATDPGITLLEAAAWAVADAHYRTANRTPGSWAVEAGLYERQPTDRHWSAQPLPIDPAQLAALADALAAFLAAADDPTDDAVRRIETAGSVHDATAALLDHDPQLSPEQATAAVRLVRQRLVLRAALDGGHELEAAISAAVDRGASDVVASAGELLAPVYPTLWSSERAAIVRRQLHQTRLRELRLRAEALRERIGAAADLGAAAARVSEATGLTGAAAEIATGIHPSPPGAWPETWETDDGATRHWPPHPLQARTVEPVTDGDYAGLARTVDGVRRAWAREGALPGVGWDGQEVEVAAVRPGAVTILVDPDDPALLEASNAAERAARLAFLRHVLRHALSLPTEVSDDAARRAADPDLRGEVDDPFRLGHDDLDRGTPRRLICDEVGAAILTSCPITLRGVLHAPVTADRGRVLVRAMQRVAAFLAAGRQPGASTRPADGPAGIGGPWPPPPPPAAGWTPGDAVRVAELVERLADDPEVLGVEALEVRTEGADWAAESVDLGPSCVPRLAADQCLKVTLQLEVAP
jgi:hypothetical protein